MTSLPPPSLTPTSCNPIEGLTTRFEVDPDIKQITSPRSGRKRSAFGLLVVALWPPPLDVLGGPYNTFLDHVRSCFDKVDVEKTDSNGVADGSAVYLYPPECLHITVSTLHAFTRRTTGVAKRAKLMEQWRSIVSNAAKRPEWPCNAKELKFRVCGAQIGRKAGIILWEEITGSLDDIRLCISRETTERTKELAEEGIDASTLSIPNIVHSTFLRFQSAPVSRGEDVQAKFSDLILSRLTTDIFPQDLIVKCDQVRMVCEWTPYMHIPYDDDHVLLEI